MKQPMIVLLWVATASNGSYYIDLTSRAETARGDGRYADAARAYMELFERDPAYATTPSLRYNAACFYALAGEPDAAFEQLSQALEHGYVELEEMLADKDLASLHDDPRWQRAIARVRARLAGIDTVLRAELLSMRDRDRALRRDGSMEGSEEMRRVDADNRARLKAIIREHGWPTESLVGADGAGAAWLIAQHADDDPEFQKGCLGRMRKAVAEGEAEGPLLAYLVDRVRTNAGQKQLYGTQFHLVDGRRRPRPIEDPVRVDERRREVGLMPLSEYAAQMEHYFPPPQPEPEVASEREP